MNFASLLALPVETALEELRAQGISARVVSSAPPFFPRGYTPHWGGERVLRAREVGAGKVELLVGNELVGEARAEKPRASG